MKTFGRYLPILIGSLIQAAKIVAVLNQDIVHLDIKPANILVSASGEVYVIDLNIAQFKGAGGLAVEGSRAGTPGYKSP